MSGQELDFVGAGYVHERDSQRLTNQIVRIHKLMADGEWRTLPSIFVSTNAPEASASAQLRHLRKVRFGSHVVQKRHIQNGLHEYRLLCPCGASCPVLATEKTG